MARAADSGLDVRAAFENEFTLARPEGPSYVPLDQSHVLLDHRDGLGTAPS